MSKPRYRLTEVGKVRNGTRIWMARPKIFVRGFVKTKAPFSRIVTVGIEGGVSIGRDARPSKQLKMHETTAVWVRVG